MTTHFSGKAQDRQLRCLHGVVPEAFRHELRVGAVEAAIWILVTLLSAQNRSVVGGFAEHVDVALEDRVVVGEPVSIRSTPAGFLPITRHHPVKE